MKKRRITVTVDEDVYQAAVAAVEVGRAGSVSAWVNDALSQQHAKQERLDGWAELIAEYEAEHGAFTAEELAEQERRDLEAAAAVRAQRATRRRAG